MYRNDCRHTVHFNRYLRYVFAVSLSPPFASVVMQSQENLETNTKGISSRKDNTKEPACFSPNLPTRRGAHLICSLIILLLTVQISNQLVHAREYAEINLSVSGSAPEIEVLSSNGKKYTHVDINYPLSFHFSSQRKLPRTIENGYYLPKSIKYLRYSSEKVKVQGHDNKTILAADAPRISQRVDLKYFAPKGPSPVTLCNSAVENKLSTDPDAQRWRLLHDGMSLTIHDAYTAKLISSSGYRYKKTGRLELKTYYWNADFYGTDSQAIDARVLCKKSPLASAPQEEPPPPVRATVKEPDLQLKLTKNLSKPVDCPTYVRITAQIRFNAAGNYTYYFDGDDGNKTSPKTVTTNGSGVKEYYWNRRISHPTAMPSERLQIAPANVSSSTRIEGWVRFNVAFKSSSGYRQTFRTMPLKFNVKCKL